jgi:hypothetical protein
VLFLAVTTDEKSALLLDRLAPILENHGLVVLSKSVEVIRPERF